jgi:ParB family transcriptional regulator, chromosome partitioning protein
MVKPKGLGRGLDALLGGSLGSTNTKTDAASASSNAPQTPQQLPVLVLKPGKYQPRRAFTEPELLELADSIREHGVIQPIIVRPLFADGHKDADGKTHEILGGERRWRAAMKVGLTDVPVVIKAVDDREALAISLIENIQREDLSPIEEALGLKRLIEEFDLTHEQAAQAVGRSRSGITNLLRLLELSQAVQTMLLEGKLEMGHARALLGVSGAQQVTLAEQTIHKNLTVRETEALVRTAQKPVAKSGKSMPTKDADIRHLEEELAELLGASVLVKPGNKGAGQLLINYSSLDHLDGILGKLRK